MQLTARQREILALAAQGLTQQEIADRLFISLATVKTTLERARRTLGARNLVHAVALCYSLGLLEVV